MSEVSEETTYYIRTSLMFTDLTKEVLFKVFKFLIKSEDITDFLSSLEQQNILRELLKKGVINNSDYNLVSGQVLNLEKFDISLLVRLILNLCKDNIPQPQRGWKSKLQPKDESLGADLLRLRDVRNKIIGHRADAKLTEAEYEKTWAKIKAILMRIVELVDSESSENFERRINEYKRLNVDKENAKVKRLLDELLNYKIEFDHLQEKVEELSRRSKEFQEYFKITPEIFVRYIKLLFDGGRIVLCGIMMTKLGDQDLSDFLEGKKEILIRNIDEKYSRCLYSQESCSDYKTWDVYLLASILLLTFDNDLSQREIMYIERIKSAMVNYAALAFRSLDAGDFLTNWTDLIICLKDLSSNIAEDDKLQIENLIERYKNKDEGGCDAEEYFKQLRESGVEVKTLNDIYNETIEELRDMLNEMSQKDIKFEKGYVFEFKLLTICENEEINKLAEDTLEINLQASIQKSDQPSGDIRRETDKAVDIIAAHPDVTPLEIKRKCIILSFNCSTPVGLLHILDVTQGDQFRKTFRNIAYEMHYIYGYAFIIQGKCTFESVSMVSRMINKSTSHEASREQISIPLKCSSVEGISSVLSVIKQGKTTNILNRIAEQMSADFNETVSIKLIPDLMEFRNVFEETDSDRSSSLGRNEFETEELVPVEIGKIHHNSNKADKNADNERKEVAGQKQFYDEKMTEYAIENKGQEGNSQTIIDKFQTIDHGQNRVEDVILDAKRTKSELGQIDLSLTEEQDSQELLEDFLEDFLDLIDKKIDEPPENILMFGRSGTGKSSLINTIHKVLTGQYFEIAEAGYGEINLLTREFIRYKNCGVKENQIVNSPCKNRIVRLIPKFPNLIDSPGFNNENTAYLRQIIELILGGYIPPNTTIEALEETQNNYGMEGLKVIYNKQNPSWKVDRIIVTYGCTDFVPKMLLEALKKVLSLYDSETGKKKYPCRLYLLITKCDLIYGKDQTQRKKTYWNENDGAIETVKKELLHILDMEGAFDNRGQLLVNLTDANKHEDAQVDRDTLIFLKKLVQPIPKQEINHDSPGWQTSLHLKVIYIKKKCGSLLNQDMRVHFHQVFIFLMIVVIVVAVLFHLVAKDPANSAKS